MDSQTRLSLRQPLKLVQFLLFNPSKFWTLAAVVIIGDVLLTALIVHFVPYTEIDWETYMIQITVYNKGERDYANISGPTGPLVYPAGHVYIHELLNTLTSGGANISLAQGLYGALYIASLTLACAIYSRARGVPNWVLLCLPLSKRLHSIFVLRMFNDCWALVAVQGAILAFSYDGLYDELASILFSLALSVKMTILLYLPGLLLILFLRHGLLHSLRHVVTIVLVQLLLGAPFWLKYPRSYLRGAFDLSRQFLYKWTVNWRFVAEPAFLSSSFARALLLGHLGTLIAFAWFRWCTSDGGLLKVVERGLRRPQTPASLRRNISPDYVITILFTSNLIGLLFARSLHYQFYSCYAQQLPLLAWRTRLPVVIRLALLLCIEYSWNVYPSTTLSSGVLLGAHIALLGGLWFGWPEGIPSKKGADNS